MGYETNPVEAKGQSPSGLITIQVDTLGRVILAPNQTVRSTGLQPAISVTKAVVAAANYDAEDVISESATVGTTWDFKDLLPTAGSKGYVVKAHVICETTSQTHILALYLFSKLPTSVLNDNVANTALLHADLAFYIGRIDFPLLSENGGDSETVATPSTAGNLPLAFELEDGADTIYGILVTTEAVAGESAGDDYTIRLQAETA